MHGMTSDPIHAGTASLYHMRLYDLCRLPQTVLPLLQKIGREWVPMFRRDSHKYLCIPGKLPEAICKAFLLEM